MHRIRADFFDAAACGRVRAAMNRGVPEPAEILGMRISHDSDVRRASSVEVDEETLKMVGAELDIELEAVADFFKMSLRRREGSSFLRYPPGGFYRVHRDRGTVPSWPAAARRQIALVIFLNSSRECPHPGDFSGGELRLFEHTTAARDDAEALVVVPQQGSLVAFPAAMLHEVLPVRAGTRDVVVDWFY